MTPAEMQQAYRRRQQAATLDAQGHPQGHTTTTILKALARQLTQLDDASRADTHDTVRDLAGRCIGELCRRYGIKPAS